MKKRKPLTLLLAAIVSITVTTPAVAGAYADSLTKCLVKSTSSADKTTLVQWMFAMMALHPQVRSMSAVTDERRSKASKDTAALFQQLMTKTCFNETRDAIKYEGSSVIEQSFNQLGQIAAREIFSEPSVAGGIAEFAKYIDKDAMEKALGGLK